MKETIIELKNVSKEFKRKNETIKALDDISINFEAGKFYAIMGHSGSGKSTLLRLIGLIDKPTTGKIYINDKCMTNLNNTDLSKLRNDNIGFIFQDFYLDKYLTATENVTIPMLINKKYKNKKEIVTKSIELLEMLGLKNRINHYPREMSGGEQQRVAIARALANNPDIILADEPTGNLDIKNEKFIFENLKTLAKSGKCVIMVSHSKDAEQYAVEIIEISEGVIL